MHQSRNFALGCFPSYLVTQVVSFGSCDSMKPIDSHAKTVNFP